MILWHPNAEQQIIPGREGKEWRGGSGTKKLILHTWEFDNRWPNYSTPPHLTLWPGIMSSSGEDELRQHVPFDKAAYAVRDSEDEDDLWTWQMECAGFAAMTPWYADDWYWSVARQIVWFVENQGLTVEFANFTVMRAGAYAPQRWDYETFDAFTGVLGHGHVGRGTDAHWDPGSIDTQRLALFVEELMGGVSLETFIGMMRYRDIDKMASDQIITQDEANYFKTGAPWPGQAEDNNKKNYSHPDWENLYNAWKVRSPIWAV